MLSVRGEEQTLARTAKADQELRRLVAGLGSGPSGLTLLASGGYGRCDLNAHSDLDLILLHKGPLDAHEDLLRKLIQSLWDSGWHPGQTLIELRQVDGDLLALPDRASALLEARLLGGDRALAEAFEERLIAHVTPMVARRFAHLKEEEYRARRAQRGEVVRVVEPHLKGGAGGLRDLHHVLWLERAAEAASGNWRLRRRRGNELRALLRRLRIAGLMTRDEALNMLRCYDLLLGVREALHRLAGRADDRLLVGVQPGVGRELGLVGSDDEVLRELMRHVFRAGQTVARFSVEMGARQIDRLFGSPDAGARQRRPDEPTVVRNRLELDEATIRRVTRDPDALGELIDRAVDRGTPLSGRSRHRLRRRLERYAAELAPARWSKLLARWFQRTQGVGTRLRSLGELDALRLWLPPWRNIAALSTGSYYHRYAVDEHTLRAIDRLDALPEGPLEGLPASLWESFEPRPVLYLAILFHDIAKGLEGDHSERGAELAREQLPRFGFEEHSEMVARLVQNHLHMEQVAFRRDSRDPAVIEEFAVTVGDRATLDALYLLTVCDLSAVAERVWTGWKARLLAELYLETRDWFDRGRRPASLSAQDRAGHVIERAQGQSLEPASVLRFLETMREEYRRAVPPEEIAHHLRAVEKIRQGQAGHLWQSEQEQGYLILTLISRDQVGLLARATGALVAHGIGVREARIFTREDGIVVDRFRCEDLEPDGRALTQRLQAMQQAWEGLEAGEVTVGDLFVGYRRRRRFRRRDVGVVESTVEFDREEEGVVVDVAGQDSDGLLYRLCAVMLDAQLDVRAARVSARLDGIHDSFLVHDPSGLLASEYGREALANRLREAFHEPGDEA